LGKFIGFWCAQKVQGGVGSAPGHLSPQRKRETGRVQALVLHQPYQTKETHSSLQELGADVGINYNTQCFREVIQQTSHDKKFATGLPLIGSTQKWGVDVILDLVSVSPMKSASTSTCLPHCPRTESCLPCCPQLVLDCASDEHVFCEWRLRMQWRHHQSLNECCSQS